MEVVYSNDVTERIDTKELTVQRIMDTIGSKTQEMEAHQRLQAAGIGGQQLRSSFGGPATLRVQRRVERLVFHRSRVTGLRCTLLVHSPRSLHSFCSHWQQAYDRQHIEAMFRISLSGKPNEDRQQSPAGTVFHTLPCLLDRMAKQFSGKQTYGRCTFPTLNSSMKNQNPILKPAQSRQPRLQLLTPERSSSWSATDFSPLWPLSTLLQSSSTRLLRG